MKMATLSKLSMAYRHTKIIRHLQFRYQPVNLIIISLEMEKYVLQAVQCRLSRMMLSALYNVVMTTFYHYSYNHWLH